MNKKAQGISINVIIIAAIALIVLVVLVAIFTGRLAIFSKEVAETGQDCEGTWEIEPCGEGFVEAFGARDADENLGKHCCVTATTTTTTTTT